MLIALTDDSVLSKVEDDEIQKPSARKQVDDTVIYVSRYMLGGAGALTICDFGQARIGSEHRGKAMPVPYRAPEVILNMKWGEAVDMWSVGLLVWNIPLVLLLFCSNTPFCVRPGIFLREKASSAYTTTNLRNLMMPTILQ